MKNLSIKAKLIFAFLVISIIPIIIGVLGMTNMKSMHNATNQMYSYNLQGINELHIIKENLSEINGHVITLAHSQDRSKFKSLIDDIEKFNNMNQEIIVSYEEKGL